MRNGLAFDASELRSDGNLKHAPQEMARSLTVASPLVRFAVTIAVTATSAFAAITGTVTNASTGKPQAGATVALYQLATATGPQLVDQAKSDSQGNFTINQSLQGPQLIRTAFDGVTYNHMLTPGQPTSGIAIDVYNASKQPGGSKVTKHMILFEPGQGQVAVTETYLLKNDGKTSWNDPEGGTLKFFLPPGASQAKIEATAPGGMPLGAPIVKTGKPDVLGIDFAIKPGDTRIDVSYTAPYTEGADLAGKIVSKDENTYLIVPSGITLTGEGLNDLGAEPRTQAHIFGLAGGSYKVKLAGNVAPAPADSGGSGAETDDSGPRIEQIMPRVNSKAVSIVIVVLGILALGFALLYRSSPTTAQSPSRRGPNA